MIWRGLLSALQKISNRDGSRSGWRGCDSWTCFKRYPLKWLLTRASCLCGLYRWRSPPRIGGKNLKTFFGTNSYLRQKQLCHSSRKGVVNRIAHITGGGFINVPRMFSDDLAEIDESKCQFFPIFKQRKMAKSNREMFEMLTFMGIGSCLQWNQKMWNVSKELLDEPVYEISPDCEEKDGASVVIK